MRHAVAARHCLCDTGNSKSVVVEVGGSENSIGCIRDNSGSVPGHRAAAAPITITFTGAVDQFNPGPFTRNVALKGQITLDDTVVASGPNNTFNNVITGFSLTISETAGDITYTNTGTGGRVQ